MARLKRPFIETPAEKAAFVYGIQLAAEVAKDYDKYSYHSHLVSECILAKLNVMKGRPHKNPWAAKIKKALDSLEQKVNNLEGTTRFMALASKRCVSCGDPTSSRTRTCPVCRVMAQKR